MNGPSRQAEAKVHNGSIADLLAATCGNKANPPADADTYETLLKTEVFPGILAKQVAGFLHIELFRRALGQEVEFMTVMWFASQEAVTAFAGEDHGLAYVPASARRVLARFDERAAHYGVRESRDAMSPR